ncbi:MAG: hypothetical protein MZV63_20820 [Marinilabiliales bacterium]|nr:hypothetical protein [Marinilabiliales bacterium]
MTVTTRASACRTLIRLGYGLGPYRPVYFVTGKPQGLAKFKNRTEGVASTAGKFASVFAMGAKVFEESDPAFAEQDGRKGRRRI